MAKGIAEEMNRKGKRESNNAKAVLLFIFIYVSLCSCISLEVEFEFTGEGAGFFTLNYTVSHMVSRIGGPRRGELVIPLPLSKAEFEQAIVDSGVTLTDLVVTDEPEGMRFQSRIEFVSYDQAAAFFNQYKEILSLGPVDEPNDIFFNLTLKENTDILGGELLEMAELYFKDNDISVKITIPAPIRSFNAGVISDTRNSIVYTQRTNDLLTQPGIVVWSVGW